MNKLPEQFAAPYGNQVTRPIPLTATVMSAIHAETVRATYIVPNGCVAILHSSHNMVQMNINGDGVNPSHAIIRFTRTTQTPLIISHCELVSAFVRQLSQAMLTHNLVLYAGDKLELVTESTDALGRLNYTINVAITEFDI